MFKSDWSRGITMIALPIAFGVTATGLACRDASTSSDRSALSFDSARAHHRDDASASMPRQWVGLAHNRALDDLRADLRKPGVLTREFCTFIVDFMVQDKRIPPGHAKGALEMRRKAGVEGLRTGTMCGGSRSDTRQVSLQSGVSSTASALFDRIQSSIDLAQDRYDLAYRLREVANAAAQLNATERSIIGAVASTAQSSFEYWQVELPYANQEFETEYAACADQLIAAGYDSDYARRICLEGKTVPTRHSPAAPRYQLWLASYGTSRGCALGSEFKTLAKADALGAFGGAVKGAMTAGLAGIGPGALVGAAVGSATSWAASAWELYWCAVK